jgi:hypothetical protein
LCAPTTALHSQYESACHVRAALSGQVAAGLPLADFVFHTLRNCHVVLMNARDEAASFKIFSTLNSRGMDLSPVDKLKADLLEVGGGRRRSVGLGHVRDHVWTTSRPSIWKWRGAEHLEIGATVTP